MKVPNILIIRDQEWAVKREANLSYRGNDCHGLADFENRTIYLNSNLTGELLELTLLHETLHASIYELGFNLKKEEELVDGLSKIICQIFKMKLK